MIRYTVEIRTYDCHPETCCHEEHFPWWIVQHKPLNGSSVYTTQKYIEGYDSQKEAQKALINIKQN